MEHLSNCLRRQPEGCIDLIPRHIKMPAWILLHKPQSLHGLDIIKDVAILAAQMAF